MKYELTKEMKIFDNIKVYRIRATENFADVKKGDLGGWVESEWNLSQCDTAWIYGNGIVYQHGKVEENAKVSEHGKVRGYGKVEGWGQVRGYAKVDDDAKVYGHAIVEGEAWICGHGEISGNAVIYGYVEVNEYGKVCGNAVVREKAVIGGHAEVTGYAEITGNTEIGVYAKVRNFARIKGKKDILMLYPIGSRNDTATFYKTDEGDIEVTSGLFSGTIKEFEKAVQKTYGDNEHRKVYKIAIELAKIRLNMN